MKTKDTRREAVDPEPAGSGLVPSVPAKPRWWHRWIRTPGELHAMGVVGINMRNARFLLPNEARDLEDLPPIPGGSEFPAVAVPPASGAGDDDQGDEPTDEGDQS